MTKTYRESRVTPEIEARREEARFFGECLNCFGSGFVWQYQAQLWRRVQTVRGDASFQDSLGTRYLVACGCAKATP